MRRRYLPLLPSAAVFFCVAASPHAPNVVEHKLPPPASRTVDFPRDIQPIFARHCYSCHGPEKQKGDLRLDVKSIALQGGSSGPSILPGKSAESRLVQFVSGIPEDMLMPKKGGRLSDEEVGLLRAWIDQGAPWPDGLEPVDFSSRRRHWALQRLIRPALPRVHHSNWPLNPVDQFILARLEKEQLAPSPEADRRTLIRRLSFDLIGLPPTPEEVREFVADTRLDAYELLVERLLSSPHYGERWARHWLDVVRFAESHGFETNLERKNAWPYRDYVIRSFNENKPYDRFVLEQLAGDALGVQEATGFIVAGPWDAVKSPDINLTLQQRMDELHDMLSTTGSTFLGLTVGCARCHNHKFDPISQKDYYAMQALFAGVQHGERTLLPPDSQQRLAQAEELQKRLAQIDRQLTQFEPLANPDYHPDEMKSPDPRLNEERFDPIDARFVRFTIQETLGNAEPCIDELEVHTAEESPRNVALASAGAKATASGTYPDSELHRLEHINDGKVGNSRSWISNQPGQGWVQIEFPEKVRINKIVWSRDREGAYTDRLPTSYMIEAGAEPNLMRRVAGRPALRPAVNPRLNVERFQPVTAKFLRFTILATTSLEPCLDELEVFTADENPRNVALATNGARATASGTYPNSELHRLEHLNDGKVGNSRSWISNEPGRGWVQVEFPEPVRINKVLWSRDREEKFADRLATNYTIEIAMTSNDWKRIAGSNDRQAYSSTGKQKSVLSSAGLTRREMEQLNRLLAEKQQGEDEINKLTNFPSLYAGKFVQPEPTFLLYRGDPTQKREPVNPGAIQGLGPALEQSAETPEQQRRLALARWLIDPKNPLTARVMVNRIWQHHFGHGIVDTPSDFGLNGARPTHPELLDWLACAFVSQGWDIKTVHRLIVLSRTYRQSSRSNTKASAVDADGRLLWRFPPRRLEAEPLRDSILSVSGNLDLRMGGPGFDLFEPNGNYVKVYIPKQRFGPAEWRRMVYQSKPRMRLDDTFGAFDCPDGGQIAPKRTTSTTPLQALSLLNSPFILEQSAIFAKRLEKEAGLGPDEQVRCAFRLAFNRDPSPAEAETALNVISEHGLVPFCRALFNANEFIYMF